MKRTDSGAGVSTPADTRPTVPAACAATRRVASVALPCRLVVVVDLPPQILILAIESISVI